MLTIIFTISVALCVVTVVIWFVHRKKDQNFDDLPEQLELELSLDPELVQGRRNSHPCI